MTNFVYTLKRAVSLKRKTNLDWPSVTDVVCTCHYLEKRANDPDVPIEFDSRLNEFHLVYQTGTKQGELIIRHCPFCGGKAPKSKRSSLFANVTPNEIHRLSKMTQPLRSLEEVLATLGTPDEDLPTGAMTQSPEKDGQPGETRVYRVLRYKSLSATVLVSVKVDSQDRVSIIFSGKYLGKDSIE